MIDFEPTDQAKEVCEEVESVIENDIRPLQETHGEALSNPSLGLDKNGRLTDELVEAFRTVVRIAGENDLLGLHLPREAGGRGLSFTELFHVNETVFGHGLGLSRHLIPIAARGPTRMLLHLSEEKQTEYLNPLLSGEKTTCLGLTEPAGGSDIASMNSTARKADDGSYVVDGHKKFVGNGPYADFIQVFAQTDPNAGINGITGFLVDMDVPGVERGRMNRDATDKGEWCEIHFDSCHVPADNMIGELGKGIDVLMEVLNKERILMAAQCSGLGRYVQQKAIEHARSRTTWGEPIGNRQAIQTMLADAETTLYAIRLMGLYGAWKLDQGEAPRLESSMTKVFATEGLSSIADDAIQVHGGDGMMKEYPFWKVYNQARAMQIYEGTSEIMRRNIARELGVTSN